MLLENQAKQLVNESSATNAGTTVTAGAGEAWAGVALPLVRRVFGEIVAKDLISVQPMNLPAGLIFYLDFQYGAAGNFKSANESLYGATALPSFRYGSVILSEAITLSGQRIIQESALCANKHMNRVMKGELELELC